MTDHDAFLRTICEYPHDLLPRLVYADWLDENDGEAACPTCVEGRIWLGPGAIPACRRCYGTGRVSNRYSERAEFIRLSCEYPVGSRIDDGEAAKRLTSLRQQCRFFWGVGARWTRRFFSTAAGPVGLIGGGFIQEIRCPLSWWIGGECECFTNEPDAHCPTCHGTGRTPANGPAVATKHPVTRVVVSDREPQHYVRVGIDVWGWYTGIGGPEYLPTDVHRRIDDTCMEQHGGWKDFPTREAAVEALSRALVSWAREQAGLTPIQWEVTT